MRQQTHKHTLPNVAFGVCVCEGGGGLTTANLVGGNKRGWVSQDGGEGEHGRVRMVGDVERLAEVWRV